MYRYLQNLMLKICVIINIDKLDNIMQNNIAQTMICCRQVVQLGGEMFKLQSHKTVLLKSFSLLQNFRHSRPHITFSWSTRRNEVKLLYLQNKNKISLIMIQTIYNPEFGLGLLFDNQNDRWCRMIIDNHSESLIRATQ